ncbi:hypothetical protein [Priestia megaterium]|uniref:hypothetical protein n=1 Tax=Priestia megaterium TaxID=1404 RepID=UPI0039F736B9
MSERIFENIKPFKFSDLNGKTLKIFTGSDSGVTTTVGKDVETGVIYVLAAEMEAVE